LAARKRKVKIAVIGAGYFGTLHAQKFAGLRGCDLIAVCDPQHERAEAAAAPSGALVVTDHKKVLDMVDAAVIAVPTVHHVEVARDCLDAGLDVLIEKPICESVAELDSLIRLARKRKRLIHVGHLERYSPVIEALMEHADHPRYIEAQRVSPFRGRGADTTVILDMMIHDLDHVLRMAGAPAVDIEAVGSPVLTDKEDLANARIRFANGVVATLTASRVGGSISRRLRVYQSNTYLIADMAEHKLTVLHPQRGGNGALPSLVGEDKQFANTDLLLVQAKAFVASVRDRSRPRVSAQDIRPVLAAAMEIAEKQAAWQAQWK
jgi:predicted dehydrogenase